MVNKILIFIPHGEFKLDFKPFGVYVRCIEPYIDIYINIYKYITQKIYQISSLNSPINAQ